MANLQIRREILAFFACKSQSKSAISCSASEFRHVLPQLSFTLTAGQTLTFI
jgi:hypothetical protein